MSYILDSLKKSEKERGASGQSASMSMSAPAFLANEEKPILSVTQTIMVSAIIFVLLALVFFMFFYKSDNQRSPSIVTPPSNVNKPLVSLPVVATPPVQQQQTSTTKEEAILLYEQAIQEKSKPEIDSLYKKLDSEKDVIEQPEFTRTPPATVSLADISATPEQQELSCVATESSAPELEQIVSSESTPSSEPEVVIPSIYELDGLSKKAIPSLDYGAHIYATDHQSGFVILNGARRRIGDQLDNGIFIEKIQEEAVVLSYKGTVFSLPAMKSWAAQ